VAEHGVVTGGEMAEAQAGVEILQAGGNAMDAVIAAAFVGFVVEPASCGIGGYGHLSYFRAADVSFATIDHYARAPQAARADMFELGPPHELKYYGFPYTKGHRAEMGFLAPAVPGAVAGLFEAHSRYGRLPWAALIAPAIVAAEAGLAVTWKLLLMIAQREVDIRRYRPLANWLMPAGRLPLIAGQIGTGERLDCSALAGTLRLIRDKGAAGFHDGPVARSIARTIAQGGGILTTEDISSYRPRILQENPCRYRGHDYITAFDQVGYEALNILGHFDLASMGPDSLEFRHVMAEALAMAYVDSMAHYGDPDHTQSPVDGLVSSGFAAERAASIRMNLAIARPVAAGDPWPYSATRRPIVPATPGRSGVAGTSQMAVCDGEGNMASLIVSHSSAFGSLIMDPETGVILNNCMQNFDPRPQTANRIEPGKMPIFAAPTLVAARDGKASFAAAGSGGYRITTGVLHSFIHAVDFGMSIQAAVDAPRVHCQGDETYVDARIAASQRDAMAKMGHRVVAQIDDPGLNAFARVNAIKVDPTTGLRHAGTGPAWASAAAGY